MRKPADHRRPRLPRTVVYGGGIFDGRFSTSLVDDRNGLLRAFAAAAIHPTPRRVLNGAHLSPCGIVYVNATGSDEVMFTVAQSFPHALRVNNMIASGECPIRYDHEQLMGALRTWAIDGKLALDPASPYYRWKVGALERFAGSIHRAPDPAGLETRESLFARLGHAKAVTDDNMLCEWRTLHW